MGKCCCLPCLGNSPPWLAGDSFIELQQLDLVLRRLREAVAETAGIEGGKVVVAGLSNTYTHYITTWEEYQRQRCNSSKLHN